MKHAKHWIILAVMFFSGLLSGAAFESGGSEAPRGPDSKRSGRCIFAEPCDLSSEALRAKEEARDCGNLLRPRGYEGQEQQSFLAKQGEQAPELIPNHGFRNVLSHGCPFEWEVNGKTYIPDPAADLSVSNGIVTVRRKLENKPVFFQTEPAFSRDPCSRYRLTCRINKIGQGTASVSVLWGKDPRDKLQESVTNDNAWQTVTREFSIPDSASKFIVRFEPPSSAGDTIAITGLSLIPLADSAPTNGFAVNIESQSGPVGVRAIWINEAEGNAGRTAAFDLRKYIYELTGTIVPVFAGDPPAAEAGNGIIYVGRAALASKALTTADMNGVGESGYRILAGKGYLALVGQNNAGLHASVFALLEKLGLKYYRHDILVKPARGPVIVPALDIQKTPAFDFCTIELSEWTYFDHRAMRLTDEADILGTPGDYSQQYSWVHSFGFLLDYDLYSKTHPEYFAREKDGKQKQFVHRSNTGALDPNYVHLCLSNPEVKKLVTARVLQWIHEQPDRKYYFISHGDGYYWCECEGCRAMDAVMEKSKPTDYTHPVTDRYLSFVNAVAREVGKKHPEKMLVAIAYTDATEEPPVRVKPEPNVCIMYALWNTDWGCLHPAQCKRNAEGQRNLAGWLRLMPGRVLIFCYPRNVYTETTQLRYYAAHGVRGVHCCGGQQDFPWVNVYLHSRLLWDVDADIEPMIDDFFNAYYGEAAAKPMREYFNLMQSENLKRLPHLDKAILVLPRPADVPSIVTPEYADKAYPMFVRALAAAGTNSNYIKRINDEHYRVLLADLNNRNKAGGLEGEALNVYAKRLADFLGIARERSVNAPYRGLPMAVWLLQTSRLAVTNANWTKDPAVDAFLKDPVGEILKTQQFQKQIDGGWKIPVIGLTGGLGPMEYDRNCPKRMAVIAQRADSPRSRIKTSLALDKTPSGEATLSIEGQDNDKPCKPLMEIMVNGREVYKGASGFVRGDWSWKEIKIPEGVFVEGTNRIEIINLTPETAYESPAEEADMTIEAVRQNYNWGWFMIAELIVKP